MKKTLLLLFVLLGYFNVQKITAQTNVRITLSDVKEEYQEGDIKHYSAKFKVVSGTLTDKCQLAVPINAQKKGFVNVSCFGDIYKVGETPKFACSFQVLGATLQNGQQLVSHDLAPITPPANNNVQFKTTTAFIGNSDLELFTQISSLKGVVRVGDRILYENHAHKKGTGTITSIDIKRDLFDTEVAFEGLPDHTFSVVVKCDQKVDLSDATCSLANGVTIANTPDNTTSSAPAPTKAKIKSIPVNAVVENKEIKITVHNLIKYNPVEGEGIDIFKVDYSLDYYIVDATVENKSSQPIDAGEYLLRFNFYSPDGKNADEFTRMFKENKNSTDEVKQDANKIDVNIFGGSGKLIMSNVMAKYTFSLPDYESKHKPEADKLSKPLQPGQKAHSVIATIMGVPPTYKIEGLGTWGGTFYQKKNLIFTPIKI
jgi:hypothetical protein